MASISFGRSLMIGSAFLIGGIICGTAALAQYPAATPSALASPGAAAAAGAPAATTVPRTRDGHPDFTGIWVPSVGLPSGVALGFDFASHTTGSDTLAGNGEDRGLDRSADMNKPAYKPEFWDVVKENDYDGDVERLDPSNWCLPQGLPRIGAPSQIVQVPQQNLIIFHYKTTTNGGRSEARFIPIDGRAHNPANVVLESWYGDSVGHWEGDTLVIESIGFTDQSWLTKSGYPHGTHMKVTELLTRTADTFTWTATVEDPEYLEEPWMMTPVTRTFNPDPDAFLPEDLPCSTEIDQHIVSHTRT